ncbi:HET-domain-containing protein [Ophiobolus disseminans]|uniref:HET-domain-containing protein n=1 Tax=Ophiobolus disseminans TaxID=1469910 RepID=A0A6A6ZNG8_9PLEO|nr:HET-domain-containing protein [Ophiobolus disseminans]
MRLINATTLKIHEFLNEEKIEPYAILSHTWGNEECTLQQMEHPDTFLVTRREGYNKILLCCKQALKDGLQWAWVDTICIDKTSTAELSEAINSMFRWYRKADKCYAYLSDVREMAQFERSRWFTRGWTLQELVAPREVWFYNADWEYLGSKTEIRIKLARVTGINTEVLITGELDAVSTARRMSWAANRQTSRPEDLAYSLMGIFSVNMPLLYGEGTKAFARLQEEILKISTDQSLFAWGLPTRIKTVEEFLDHLRRPTTSEMHGLLAGSPSDFTSTEQIHVLEDTQFTLPPIVSNGGVRIELQVKRLPNKVVQFAVIYCTLMDKYKYYLGIPMILWGERWFARIGEPVLISVTDLVTPESAVPFCNSSVLFVKAPPLTPYITKTTDTLELVQVPSIYKEHYRLHHVNCSKYTEYSATDSTLTIPDDRNSLHAVYYFTPTKDDPIQLFPSLDYQRIKGQHGTMLDAYRQTHSFVTTATCPKKTGSYSIVYPRFAILVGGTRKSPWVESVIVLSDDNTEKEFNRLHTVEPDLMRFCTTMQHLTSLLSQDTFVSPLTGHQRQHGRLTVALWSYDYRWQYGIGPQREVRVEYSKGKERLSVDTRIQMVSRNLVERSLVLFVELAKAGEPKRNVDRQPRWWALQGTK